MQKLREGKLIVVEKFPFTEIKTKPVIAALAKLGVAQGLLVVEEANVTLEKSVRNIPNVKLIRVEGLNVYDLVRYEHAILTRGALEKVQEVLKS